MKSFLAVITPVRSDAHPDHTLPGDLPHPDQGLPGDQPYPSHPIYIPDDGAHPDHTLPGDLPHPDQGLPGDQPYPDAGLPPFPSHPIIIPPDLEVPPELPGLLENFEVAAIWSPENGWQTVLVPTGEHPTPSKRRG